MIGVHISDDVDTSFGRLFLDGEDREDEPARACDTHDDVKYRTNEPKAQRVEELDGSDHQQNLNNCHAEQHNRAKENDDVPRSGSISCLDLLVLSCLIRVSRPWRGRTPITHEQAM